MTDSAATVWRRMSPLVLSGILLGREAMQVNPGDPQTAFLAPLDVAALRNALRRIASTVHVVAIRRDKGSFFATTATAVVSVSLQPPTLLVCLNRSAVIADVILQRDVFTISALKAGQQDIAAACSGRVEHEKREAYFSLSPTVENAPLLIDAQATFVCRRVNSAVHGTHVIVWGQAIDVSASPVVAPLLYLNGGYGGFYSASPDLR